MTAARGVDPAGWPTVWNGGPAAPRGAPTLRVEFEVATVSETNERVAKAKIRRKDAQRAATGEALTPFPAADQLQALVDSGGPWCVRLTRLSPGGTPLDRSNLPPALKAVEDAVAAALGTDDGHAAFGVTWAQEKRRGPAGVRVEVWGPGALPVLGGGQ